MIGRTWPHFKVTVELGSGGMGKVYRDEDSKLGGDVWLLEGRLGEKAPGTSGLRLGSASHQGGASRDP